MMNEVILDFPFLLHFILGILVILVQFRHFIVKFHSPSTDKWNYEINFKPRRDIRCLKKLNAFVAGAHDFKQVGYSQRVRCTSGRTKQNSSHPEPLILALVAGCVWNVVF